MNVKVENNHEFDYVPSRLVISSSQDRKLSAILANLKKQAPAVLVLLADRNGQIIYSSDDREKGRLVELAALLAGDLAASEEIARLTDNREEQQLILREGEKQHSYVVEAGPHLVLFAQTSSDVPLGWSRMLVQEAAEQLGEMFAEVSFEEDETPPSSDDRGIEESLDQALDDLWK